VLRIHAAGATDTGLVRKHNEDNAFTGSRVFVVADGMGGHAAGETASALATARFAALDDVNRLDTETLRAFVALANADILGAARADPQRRGMGTTVAGLGLTSIAGTSHWLVFNVGDCRVYRYAGGGLSQLTIDHTEVAELVAAGRITAGQARVHPRRNVVTRALGGDPAPQADVWIVPAVGGDRFVVCSDGLTLEVDDARLAQTLAACPDASVAAPALVGAALAAGGRDNVTVIVLDTEDTAVDGMDAGEAGDDTVPRDLTVPGCDAVSGRGSAAAPIYQNIETVAP
jgi:protein phosphatase